MLDQNRLTDVVGSTVYDSAGDKIGKVGEVYTDDQTGQATWATVNTGLFGTNESFVPIADATFDGDDLSVPYTKDQVKDAPNVASDGHLSPEGERQLYAHYNMSYDDTATTDTTGTAATTGGTDGYVDAATDTAGDTSTDDAMTRSEERVEVGTQTQEAGRARLRKYVVTENVTETVPVTKERAVLEREPITDENAGDAYEGPEISEAEHDVVLHEERPVVEKVVEPVERVRLGTEQIQDQETVSEEVRKEQIDVEGDVSGDVSDRGDAINH